jgi:hypothetical protein
VKRASYGAMFTKKGSITIKLDVVVIFHKRGFMTHPDVPGKSTRVYPKVSGLAAWSENCKWYRSLLLGAVVSLFCEPV